MRRLLRAGPTVLLLSLLAPAALDAADLSTFFAQPAASAAPTLAFEEQAVVVAGLAPGARLAWLSLASEPQRYWVRHVRREGVELDGDLDGSVRLELEGAVPPRSYPVPRPEVDTPGGGESP
ncbi:MAG: hypothetical protein ACRDH5_08470 [bacterium]